MKKLFNKDEEEFIKKNVKGITNEELTKRFNEHFNREVLIKQMRNFKSTYHIPSGLVCRSSIFTKKEQQFIRDNARGKSNAELTELFNKKFNKNFSLNQIRFWKERNKISGGLDTKFKKGQKQIYTYSRPVGSECVKYFKGIKMTYIKVANPRVWELKQNYIYKKYKGDIPETHCVIFLDGNRDNFNPDNLELISKVERGMMNLDSFFCKNSELTKTGLLLTKLKLKTREKEVE